MDGLTPAVLILFGFALLMLAAAAAGAAHAVVSARRGKRSWAKTELRGEPPD